MAVAIATLHARRKRNYIGLSSLRGHLTIAVVNPDGELLFAEETVAPRREDETAAADVIAGVLEKYCDTDAEKIIGIAGSRHNSDHAEVFSFYGPREVTFQRHYYAPRLALAAGACFTSPFDEALCAVVEGGKECPCARFIYRQGELFELYPVSLRREVPNPAKLCSGHKGDCTSKDSVDCHLATSVSGVCCGETRFLSESLAPRSEPADPAVYDEALFELLRSTWSLGRSDRLIFSGARAANPVSNGRITERTAFRNVHIPFAPSRQGGAIGAAFLAFIEDGGSIGRPSSFQTPFLGPDLPDVDLRVLLQETGFSWKQGSVDGLCAPIADLLAAGKIVLWNQGRGELGPRALGNRSILMDPRLPHLQEIVTRIHAYTSGRRSFGLSLLHEYGLELSDHYRVSPYMERAFELRPKFCRRIPAAVSAEGTTALQSVRRDWNERFYDLIFSFYRISGIPAIANLGHGTGGATVVQELLAAVASGRVDVIVWDGQVFVRQHSR